MRSATLTATAAALALGLASCGEKEEGPLPLNPATVKAAVEKQAQVTSFCELDQHALEPDESVTCPAAGRTPKGPVEGELMITREGETTEQIRYEFSLSGPGGNRVGGGEVRLAPAG